MSGFIESTVEARPPSPGWGGLGWSVAHGPRHRPGHTRPRSASDYGQIAAWSSACAIRTHPAQPRPSRCRAGTMPSARLNRPEGPTLEALNRAFHHMIVDGITVEYRDRRRDDSGRTGPCNRF